jgi:hypothetical protein
LTAGRLVRRCGDAARARATILCPAEGAVPAGHRSRVVIAALTCSRVGKLRAYTSPSIGGPETDQIMLDIVTVASCAGFAKQLRSRTVAVYTTESPIALQVRIASGAFRREVDAHPNRAIPTGICACQAIFAGAKKGRAGIAKFSLRFACAAPRLVSRVACACLALVAVRAWGVVRKSSMDHAFRWDTELIVGAGFRRPRSGAGCKGARREGAPWRIPLRLAAGVPVSGLAIL